jgi:hypothetical protein
MNPLTALLQGGRSLIAGAPEEVGFAFAIGSALAAAFAVWALRGMRSAERAG